MYSCYLCLFSFKYSRSKLSKKLFKFIIRFVFISSLFFINIFIFQLLNRFYQEFLFCLEASFMIFSLRFCSTNKFELFLFSNKFSFSIICINFLLRASFSSFNSYISLYFFRFEIVLFYIINHCIIE